MSKRSRVSAGMTRVAIGDVVRLYGYNGTFTVEAPRGYGSYPFYAAREMGGFHALECSIVEINGRPVPMLSCPIAPPADDYPHEPQFDYSDGPQERAQEAIAYWQKQQPVAAS